MLFIVRFPSHKMRYLMWRGINIGAPPLFYMIMIHMEEVVKIFVCKKNIVNPA